MDQLGDIKTLDDFSIWIHNTKHLTDKQSTTLRYKLYDIETINEEVINWVMGFTWVLNEKRLK